MERSYCSEMKEMAATGGLNEMGLPSIAAELLGDVLKVGREAVDDAVRELWVARSPNPTIAVNDEIYEILKAGEWVVRQRYNEKLFFVHGVRTSGSSAAEADALQEAEGLKRVLGAWDALRAEVWEVMQYEEF